MMVAIVDYGLGNIFSVKSSLNYIGVDSVVTGDHELIKKADKIILPGVGAFRDAINKLRENNLDVILKEEAKNNKPILGICLGMQLLFEKSYEYGEYDGLGLLKGQVCSISGDIADKTLKVPHMGWNNLVFVDNKLENKLLKYINQDDYVYYVHSYYVKNNDENLVAYSDYDVKISGIVSKNNIFGTQFHPEKSGEVGLNILKAFCEI